LKGTAEKNRRQGKGKTYSGSKDLRKPKKKRRVKEITGSRDNRQRMCFLGQAGSATRINAVALRRGNEGFLYFHLGKATWRKKGKGKRLDEGGK